MSPRADTWMPMYWGDYARDTGHLNAAGHGAYLMLIKHYWCTGSPLADDDDELWRIACCDSKKDWLKLRPKIVRMFDVHDGTLHHRRIDKEISKARSLSDAKVEAGKKGAEKRWQDDRSANGTAIAEPSPANTATDGTAMADPLAEPSNSQWQNDAHARASSQPQPHIPSSLRSEGADESETGKQSPPDLLGGQPPDARTQLWNEGLAVYRALTGKPSGLARNHLGKLVKGAGDDAARVLTILREARDLRPVDPQAWLEAAVQARQRNQLKTEPIDPDDPWGAAAWARSYPGIRWAAYEGRQEPALNDLCIGVIARELCGECDLDPKARPKLDAVAEWAADGINALDDAPLAAIKAQLERMAGEPIHSLKVFDFAVRGAVRRRA